MPDGAYAYPAYEGDSVLLKSRAGWRFAYPAYEYDSVLLKPRAGWRLRLSGLQVRCY
ncbi:hypothetical protein ACR9H8_18775 [Kosakonia cowanii]|jgi:hypothetical protein